MRRYLVETLETRRICRTYSVEAANRIEAMAKATGMWAHGDESAVISSFESDSLGLEDFRIQDVRLCFARLGASLMQLEP